MLAEAFNTRELAVLVWLGLFVLLVFALPKIRPSAINVLKALCHWKLLFVLSLMLTYVTAVVVVLAHFDLWAEGQTAETVYWFLGPAVVLLSRITDAGTDKTFLRTAIRRTIAYTFILEFLVNLYPFHFAIEFFILIPLSTVLALLVAVAGTQEDQHDVKRMLEVVMTILGFALLAYTVWAIVTDIPRFTTKDNLRDFIVPLVLTISFLPFLYIVAVVATYETLFLRVDWMSGELAGYTKRRILMQTRFRLRSVQRISEAYPRSFSTASNRDDVKRAVRKVLART
jgi:hypothetical protein